MKRFIVLAALLALTAGRGGADLVLSCAGDAGLRGYQLVVNDNTNRVELSIYSLLSSESVVWIEREKHDVRLQSREEAQSFQFRIAPMGLIFAVEDQATPIFSVRQFGIRLVHDACHPDDLVWRPDILLNALSEEDQSPEYASNRRSSTQLPLASE